MENLPSGPELPSPSPSSEKGTKKSDKKSGRGFSVPIPIEKASPDKPVEKKSFAGFIKDRSEKAAAEKPPTDKLAAEAKAGTDSAAEKELASATETIIRTDLVEHLQARQAQLESEPAGKDAAQPPAAKSAGAFLARAGANFEDTSVPLDEAIPTATDEIIQTIDSKREASETPPPQVADHATAETPAPETADETTPDPAARPAGPSHPPTPPVPPTPPLGPNFSQPPLTPSPAASSAPPAGRSPGIAPRSSRTETIPDMDSSRARHARRRQISAFATGVVVGEIHGRHVIKKRAAREIGRQKARAAASETQVRTHTAEQLKKSLRPQVESSAAAIVKKAAPEQTPEKAPPAAATERTQASRLSNPEATPLDTSTEETGALPVSEVSDEPIILPRVETLVDAKIQAESQSAPLEAAIPAPRYHFEQMATPQLLEVAEKIRVGGENLRDIYNQDRLDRPALIKVLKEAYQGHDIKHALEDAELGRERQIERARELRHDDPTFSKPGDAATGAASARDVDSSLPASPHPETLEPIHANSEPDLSLTPSAASPSRKSEPSKKTVPIAAATVFTIGLGLALLWFLLG